MSKDHGPNKNSPAKHIRIDIGDLTDDELVGLVRSLDDTLGELFANVVTVE